jgi:hypothetical protein
MRPFFITLFVSLSSTALFAGPVDKTVARETLERIARETVAPPNAKVVDPMSPPAPAMVDTATQSMYFAALREYYAYRIAGLQHRRRVFGWQLFSSKVIFVTVLLLVLAGIYFAAVQFHSGLAHKGEPERATELEASLKGFKVTSPVLGVIILVISLAFFYCYLVYVYPISEIF